MSIVLSHVVVGLVAGTMMASCS